MAEFTWIDKVDGVDDVYAEDVNVLASGIVENAYRISANKVKIDDNTAKINKNAEVISNLKEEVGNISTGDDRGKNEIVISPYRTYDFDGGDKKAHKRADYVLDPFDGDKNVEIINEAISTLSHADGSKGGEIVFFGGYVPITSGIIVDVDNVKISGNGVCFQMFPDVGNVFEVSGNNVNVSDVKFLDQEGTDATYKKNVFYITGSSFSAENCKLEIEYLTGWFFYVIGGSHFSANKCYSETGLASNNGFFLQSFHANVSNCNFFSIGIPLIVNGVEVSVISNTFSSYSKSEFNSSGVKVFGNVFESRDIVPAVKGGSGNIFVGNKFIDFYGYESENDCVVEISNKNIFVGNEFVTDYSKVTYPALKINGSNNIYAANILNSVVDNGTNNITYLSSEDIDSFKTTVNNTLESESETEALSANMGRELNVKISSLEDAISGVETILSDANELADSYIEGGTA